MLRQIVAFSTIRNSILVNDAVKMTAARTALDGKNNVIIAGLMYSDLIVLLIGYRTL